MKTDTNKEVIKNSNIEILEDIREIIVQARSFVIRNVNTCQVLSNILIGKRIVEQEQEGNDRASYGKEIIKKLSKELKKEFGRGYSISNLEYMRKFYLIYGSKIFEKSQTLFGKLECKKSQTSFGIFENSQNSSFSDKLPLSWSHYLLLMNIKNIEERIFYEIETQKGNWTFRELKRQFHSALYERLSLSRDKEEVKQLSEKGLIVETAKDIIKDPIVLEFLGLEEKSDYSENDMETAIINNLEVFLLELGSGFLFEARQKRFSFDTRHFFVDLVFYNRLLRSYVLIDLKIGDLKHQDLGQMQMYVNYFDRYVKLEEENPTIGILLCHDKSDDLVELTLPKDSNIYASNYELYLPKKEALKQVVAEATAEWEAQQKRTTDEH